MDWFVFHMSFVDTYVFFLIFLFSKLSGVKESEAKIFFILKYYFEIFREQFWHSHKDIHVKLESKGSGLYEQGDSNFLV